MFASKGSIERYRRKAVKKYIILSKLSKKWGKIFVEDGNPTNLKPSGTAGWKDRKIERMKKKYEKFGYKLEK